MAEKQPSLQDILECTTPEKLDRTLTDKQLSEVARYITNWLTLAPFMGISEAMENTIRHNWLHDTEKQKIEFLREWQKGFGSKATFRKLCESLFQCGEVALAEKVCEIASNESDPPRPELPDVLCPHAQYLRDKYDTMHSPSLELQWPPPPPTSKVFNLAMIHTENIQYGQMDEEQVRLLQRGNIEGFMKERTVVQMRDLFTLDKKKRKIVLIEGAPGSGKSTLAWHACQEWKALNMFQEFKIAVYVQLRDTKVQKAQSIADLLPAGSDDKRMDAAEAIRGCQGKDVLFVLDGWDEFEPSQQPDTIVYKLIHVPHELEVPHSALVITSRPISSAKLQVVATSRVELVGFTPEEVSKYFHEVVASEYVDTLQKQLKDLPLIEASCYLPLNAAIVAHLFLVLNKTLPKTLYDVYSALVCNCIVRHQWKQGKTVNIPSLDQIPCDMKKPFETLCVLAYKASLQNKVVFSRNDISSYGISGEIDGFGLLQVVQSFSFGVYNSYHFLHCSVQELLAAKHISQLEPADQRQEFDKLFTEPQLAPVFRFYAAITKLKTHELWGIVKNVIKGWKPDKHASQGWVEWRQHVLNFLHCLYEVQDTSLCLHVADLLDEGLDLGSTTLNSFSCLSVGYFLCCVCGSREREFAVKLEFCGLDNYNLSLLAKELTKCSVADKSRSSSMEGCLDINLTENRNLDGHGTGILCDMVDRTPIRKLNFSHNQRIQVGKDGFCCLMGTLRNSKFLTELRLVSCNVTINAENGPVLAEMLSTNCSLKVLNLNGNNQIGDAGVKYITRGMIKNDGVLNLELSWCGIGEQGCKLLGAMLMENNHLKCLNLIGNTGMRDAIMELCFGLKENSSLKVLCIRACEYEFDCLKRFVLCLKENCCLHTLVAGEERTVNLLERERTVVNVSREKRGHKDLKICSEFRRDLWEY